MLHINLEEPFPTPEIQEALESVMCNAGCVYYNFIHKINLCKNDHSFHNNKCPICDEEVVESYIKIVGYYVKTSSYSSERKEEMENRVFYGGDKIG